MIGSCQQVELTFHQVENGKAHKIKTAETFLRRLRAAYVLKRNLYPYTRFVPRWADFITVVKVELAFELKIDRNHNG